MENDVKTVETDNDNDLYVDENDPRVKDILLSPRERRLKELREPVSTSLRRSFNDSSESNEPDIELVHIHGAYHKDLNYDDVMVNGASDMIRHGIVKTRNVFTDTLVTFDRIPNGEYLLTIVPISNQSRTCQVIGFNVDPATIAEHIQLVIFYAARCQDMLVNQEPEVGQIGFQASIPEIVEMKRIEDEANEEVY